MIEQRDIYAALSININNEAESWEKLTTAFGEEAIEKAKTTAQENNAESVLKYSIAILEEMVNNGEVIFSVPEEGGSTYPAPVDYVPSNTLQDIQNAILYLRNNESLADSDKAFIALYKQRKENKSEIEKIKGDYSPPKSVYAIFSIPEFKLYAAKISKVNSGAITQFASQVDALQKYGARILREVTNAAVEIQAEEEAAIRDNKIYLEERATAAQKLNLLTQNLMLLQTKFRSDSNPKVEVSL